MCPTPVCGILCGQRQRLAGAIPAGLCGIFGSPLFHSMNNMKTVRGPPREVGCHKEWDCRAEKLQPGSNKQRMIQALQKPRGSQSITSFSSYCSPPKIRSVSFALSAGRRIVQIIYNYPIWLYHAKCELFNSHLRSNMQHFYECRDASPHYMPSHSHVQTVRFPFCKGTLFLIEGVHKMLLNPSCRQRLGLNAQC